MDHFGKVLREITSFPQGLLPVTDTMPTKKLQKYSSRKKFVRRMLRRKHFIFDIFGLNLSASS